MKIKHEIRPLSASDLSHPSPEKDWFEQERLAICSLEELSEHLPAVSSEINLLKKVCKRFRMKITPYYLKLIDPDNPLDPLRKMAVPDARELHVERSELTDPIGDRRKRIGKRIPAGISRRYVDRILFFPTPFCGGYCRHCFRRHLAGRSECALSESQVSSAMEYIESNPEIEEVILSGGDPLMLENEKLMKILKRIRSIPHVQTIRIHTRMPVWNPYRITKMLSTLLREASPLWVVTHFNHPRELSPLAVERVGNLVDAGIPVMNQAVLLRGVNDSSEIQCELSLALVRARVKPYYLHHLDKAKGISHFRTSLEDGMKIVGELWGSLPGYAIPQYILDIPGGHGKVPLLPQFLK